VKKIDANIVVAQSGGPTAVINSSLAGIVEAIKGSAALKRGCKVLGALHGAAGILDGNFIDLGAAPAAKLKRIALTPSSALGSCRLKPSKEDCRNILAMFKKRNVGMFFYIGGNDSADTARIIWEAADADGWPLACWHVPKTIDNDLRSCDHTPGYGSAAKFVASAVMGDDLDNRALGGVKIDVIMGRDAGFLAAASALARRRPDDGPHLVYLPEVPFSRDKFAADVKGVLARLGRCVVAVSEGIRGEDGVPVAAKLGTGEKDQHGNIQMSGTGALGDALARLVREETGVSRVRADTFGYLQRSFPGLQSRHDFALARDAGANAALFALRDFSEGAEPRACTVGIARKPGRRGAVSFKPLPISEAARETRCMPREFISPEGNDVTEAFLDYARPIAGTLPFCEIF